MGYTAASRWAQFIGWIIVILYGVGFLFWLGVGIYVAADTPSNLEHILFSTINIFSLIPLILFLLRLFASGDDWWENGTPSPVYIIGFWILAATGLLSSLFVLLRSILDNQFNNSSDEMLLQALDGTLLAISTVSFIYQLVVGIVVLLINRKAIVKYGKKMIPRVNMGGLRGSKNGGVRSMSKTTSTQTTYAPVGGRFMAGQQHFY